MSHALVTLLHVCDSLFPVGAFAHSDGLEAAVSDGLVRDVPALRAWMGVMVSETLGGCEAPAARDAWCAAARTDTAALAILDEELHAMRPAAAGREASRTTGTRLLRTFAHIRPSDRLHDIHGQLQQATFPVAFGVVCATSDVPLQAALESFMYTRLASAVSAAMRLMPLGQHEAHALLAEVLAGVPARASNIASETAPPRAFTPLVDVAAMGHQYLHSRLFRS